MTDVFSLVSGNTQYALFFSNDGDGWVDLYLRNADSDQVKGKWNATRQSGVLKLLVDDSWWDDRAVSLWTGQPRNWTFYWVVVPAGTVLNGGEPHQPTFTVLQTALPNYAISSSSAAMASASFASASRSLTSEDPDASTKALQNNPQPSTGGTDFPAWAIALVVVLGVVTLTSILSLVFVVQRYLRRKQHRDDRRNSMGSESPMMATATADPSSPTHESSYAGHQTVLPALVRSPPSIQHDKVSVHSKDPMISTNEAAYMADAFRKALRRPDFADRPQEEGESPETNAVQTEERLLQSELAVEGQNIRSVSSERGVKVVTDDERDKAR